MKPFIDFFGKKSQRLKLAAKRLVGVEVRLGDVGVMIPFLPRVNIYFVIWEGDEEFPPNGKVLLTPA